VQWCTLYQKVLAHATLCTIHALREVLRKNAKRFLDLHCLHFAQRTSSMLQSFMCLHCSYCSEYTVHIDHTAYIGHTVYTLLTLCALYVHFHVHIHVDTVRTIEMCTRCCLHCVHCLHCLHSMHAACSLSCTLYHVHDHVFTIGSRVHTVFMC
jgi:hypothetical protein